MAKYLEVKEIVGWYGAGAILLAYILNTFNAVDSSNWIYQLLNLTGAIGIVVISLSKGAKQPAVLNLVWALVALVAIVQLLLV